MATHKISRLITKDKVTAFVRAPFTRFQEAAGHGELEEEARGEGLRRRCRIADSTVPDEVSRG